MTSGSTPGRQPHEIEERVELPPRPPATPDLGRLRSLVALALAVATREAEQAQQQATAATPR